MHPDIAHAGAQLGIRPPFYLCDFDRLRKKYHQLEDAFRAFFPQVIIGYSYKTNYIPALCRELHSLGAYAEVVSNLEYQLAGRLQVPGHRVIFNGPGKSFSAIAIALQNGSLVNLDSLEEVDFVCRWTDSWPGATVGVGLRVSVPLPGSDSEQRRSRFGMTLGELGELAVAARKLRSTSRVRIRGLHAHLSTKSRGVEVFEHTVAHLGEAIRLVGQEELEYIDIGGGFGSTPPEMTELSFPSFPQYAAAIHQGLRKVLDRLDAVTLILEPGISLINDCVSYYAPVLALKPAGNKTLAVVDGSVHVVKPTRHRYNLPMEVLRADYSNKDSGPALYDVVGYTCMEDDFLAIDAILPCLEVGDMIRFGNVGAYTIVFKPPFIRLLPPVYALSEGRVSLIKREETLEDLLATYGE